MAGELAENPSRARHVAIIMDGNGRWAVRRGFARTAGHHRGVERVREIVQAAPGLGVETLTLYAFSTENWHRPGYEVAVLMALFRRYILREVGEIDAQNVRVRFLGERERLPRDLQRLMTQMEERTAGNTGLLLQPAISYGGRSEILRAARQLAAEAAAGSRDPAAITEEDMAAALYTGGTADPDLVIRTSGETRISNFLLWQAAYAEFAFVEECWPDFTAEQFARLLAEFAGRDRRFGRVAAAT
ncbi:polyprenyl diphosphate synthase [Paralimibaculum aggregatum]|uniref:Isoprenyl transferase n=1 Tax=Paralimibaculum aggregatum TaxID=3036245 RepID=A0ABQ6LK75_9RHOB|nr:polyprenyl diphosphate synthase [Limibaculum sp. NKW23]GMG83655.1 polyprenyl diphosphate synthase [Limibaculum sp. NKW23]